MNFIKEGSALTVRGAGPRAVAVLERLGYIEEDVVAKNKSVEKKKEVVTKPVTKKEPDVKTLVQTMVGGTRSELMAKVKEMGVKNFRVLNKAELSEIVAGASTDRMIVIVDGAVARWKAGWKTK